VEQLGKVLLGSRNDESLYNLWFGFGVRSIMIQVRRVVGAGPPRQLERTSRRKEKRTWAWRASCASEQSSSSRMGKERRCFHRVSASTSSSICAREEKKRRRMEQQIGAARDVRHNDLHVRTPPTLRHMGATQQQLSSSLARHSGFGSAAARLFRKPNEE
jgi:hypothetical protein